MSTHRPSVPAYDRLPPATRRRKWEELCSKALALLVTAFAAGSTISCQTTDPDSLISSVQPDAAYKESGINAEPIPEAGNWWTRFNDGDLNRLMDEFEGEIEPNNRALRVALARYDQARAALGLASADRFPSITADGLWKRKRDTASGIFVPDTLTYSQYRGALNLDYEIDLWGRVRQSVAAAEAEFAASAADLAGAELSLRAELARTWSQWRSSHNSIRIVTEALELRKKNLTLVEARVDGGEADQLELARAETEFESADALLIQLKREAVAIEHSLAILVGRSPANFSAGTPSGTPKLVSIPTGLPSELLARRPDIVAAERRLSAAAERIGVVKASYLPRITLGGIGGLSSLDINKLLDADSLFGEIGPNISIPIFQGGRAISDNARIGAQAREALASYEEVVLDAFREVETAVSDIGFLDQETAAYRRAVTAAEKAESLSRKRYEGGLSSQLEVIDAERTALDAQRELTRSIANRRLATIRLIQALGGGWEKP